MKLQKFLQKAAKVSRRKADQLISQGRVKVNSKVIKEYWYNVDLEKDTVTLDDEKLFLSQTNLYYLFNKPAGYITTMSDPQKRPTVWDLVKNRVEDRVFPVGRLDKDTEGLLILTNDGEFANRLMHPRYKIPKKYEAIIDGILTEREIEKLQNGVTLKDGYETLPARVKVIKKMKNKTVVQIEIKEGKKRQVKNMFLAVGHRVLYLKRLAIGPLTLEGIEKIGEIRKMSEVELEKIRRLIGNFNNSQQKKFRKDVRPSE